MTKYIVLHYNVIREVEGDDVLKRITLFTCMSIILFSFCAEAATNSDFDAMSSNLVGLKEKIDLCEKSGIPTDTERVNYTVIEKFIDYGKEDLLNGYTERADYTLNCLNNLYNEADESLSAYLSSEKESYGTNRYVSGNIEKNNLSFVSEISNTKTGRAGTGNIFLTGFMGGISGDLEKMTDLGMNMISVENGVWDVIIPSGGGLYGGYVISSGTDSAKAYRETGTGQNSSASLRFSNLGGSVSVTKKLAIEPGTEYEVGCVSRNISGEGVIISTGYTADAAIKNTSSRFASTKVSFNSGENESLTIVITSKNVGENIIDNLFVRKKGTYDNILINGDFETDIIKCNGYDIDCGALDETVRIIEKAEQLNIAVDLLISPHYFPPFILAENAEYVHGGSGFGSGGAEWSKQRIRDVMCDYVDAVAKTVKGCGALKSICLMNEPMFNLMYSNNNDILSLWHAWIEEKYGDRETVGSKHGTTYKSISDVPIPTEIQQTQLFYDWKSFNEEFFADFHKMLADRIKADIPDILIHTKMVDYMSRIESDYEYSFLLTGTEANLFSEFSDIHGNDAHAYIEPGHMYRMQSKLQWYDYLTTVDNKPIFNSEDHIIMDQSKIYDYRQARHVACDIWQGALHGRSISTIWVYGRTYDESSLLMDSILNRPDCVAAVGKTNIELNRVSDKIAELQNTNPEIGVVFSTASRVYNRNYMNCLYTAYEAANYSGFRVAVLDEKALSEGKADMCKVVILPDTKYMSEDSVEALAAYVKNGGKIIALGNSCLRYDDYKKGISSTLKSAVLGEAVRFSTSYDWYQLTSPSADEILGSIREIIPNEVKIVDSSTGKEMTDIEYRWIDDGRGKVINLCRYNWTDGADVDIYINGKKTDYLYDVVNGNELSGVTVDGYTPVLLYAEAPADITVSNGRVTAENVSEDDKIIQAVYDSDGKMVKCSVSPANEKTDVLIKNSGQNLKIMVWDKMMKPLTESVNN